MEGIETSLIPDKKVDHDAGGEPYGEAEDVNERIKRTLPDVAEGNNKVVPDHRGMVIIKETPKTGEWLLNSIAFL
jgi:hypothetical protein